MAKQNIVITANANNVTVTGWNVKTGEYNIQNCMVVLEDIDDLTEDIQLYKWFAVFKYDKKEYESEIIFDVNADGTIDYTKGRFDLPVFDKPGYVSVGVYGYELRVDEIASEKLKENISKEEYDTGKKVYTGYVNNTFVRSFDFTQGCKDANSTFFESVLDTTKTGCALSGKYTITLKDANATWTTFTPYVTYTYTPLNPDTGEFEMSLRYSPEMELCEVERGSTTTQPIPSPGTYMRLKQMIEEIKGQGFVTQAQFDALKALVEELDETLDNELVYGLANALELSKGEDGKYHTTYKELYTIVDNYFNQSGVLGRQGGEHIEEIRKLLTFIPSGGAPNQMLYKKSADDYDLEWRNHPIPTGGNQGQRLVKDEGGDYSLAWANEPVPAGGNEGQVLYKDNGGDYKLKWGDLPTPPSPGLSKAYYEIEVDRSAKTTSQTDTWAKIISEYASGKILVLKEKTQQNEILKYTFQYFDGNEILFEHVTVNARTTPPTLNVEQIELKPDAEQQPARIDRKTVMGGVDFNDGFVEHDVSEGKYRLHLIKRTGEEYSDKVVFELQDYGGGGSGGITFNQLKLVHNSTTSAEQGEWEIQVFNQGTRLGYITAAILDDIVIKPVTDEDFNTIIVKIK